MYKHIFIKSFYKELLLFFKSIDKPFDESDYKSMTSDSEVIRKYLKVTTYNITLKEENLSRV